MEIRMRVKEKQRALAEKRKILENLKESIDSVKDEFKDEIRARL